MPLLVLALDCLAILGGARLRADLDPGHVDLAHACAFCHRPTHSLANRRQVFGGDPRVVRAFVDRHVVDHLGLERAVDDAILADEVADQSRTKELPAGRDRRGAIEQLQRCAEQMSLAD